MTAEPTPERRELPATMLEPCSFDDTSGRTPPDDTAKRPVYTVTEADRATKSEAELVAETVPYGDMAGCSCRMSGPIPDVACPTHGYEAIMTTPPDDTESHCRNHPDEPCTCPDTEWHHAEPEPITAPVTAEGLRERLTDVVAEWALMYPLANWPWPGRTLAGADAAHLDAIARDLAAAWGRDIADRVLAALAGDPGDLPARMAEAIANTVCDHVEVGAACSECRAAAAMSVRWEHAARQAAEVERLRAIITSLDCATAERDAAVRRRDQAENRASLYRAQVADLKTEWDGAEAQAERLRDERDAVVASVRTAQITHIRETHPDRMHHPDCGGCWVFLGLSRDLPSRPDDPDEIRRLMQATTEETDDG